MTGAGREVELTEPTAGVVIRAETLADHKTVSKLLTAAFGSEEVARLVEAIRVSPYFVPELSLVAEIGESIAGHVMISYAAIRAGEVQNRIAILSPLGVAPEFQRQGIGSALVRRVTALADERGEPVVVLEGSPSFYTKLGFEYSVPYGIHITLPAWAPPEASQVLRLRTYAASIWGQVIYPPAFDEVTGHCARIGNLTP